MYQNITGEVGNYACSLEAGTYRIYDVLKIISTDSKSYRI